MVLQMRNGCLPVGEATISMGTLRIWISVLTLFILGLIGGVVFAEAGDG